jgi:hypothetical protein
VEPDESVRIVDILVGEPDEPRAHRDASSGRAEPAASLVDLLVGLHDESAATTVDIRVGKPDEHRPGARVSVSVSVSVKEKQGFDDTTLTADDVVAKVTNAYFAGLKRCYREYLKQDATARGELVLNVTVTPTGRTINGRANGVSDELADCSTRLMADWRFRVPKDKNGDPTQASFRIALTLVPE